MIVSHRHLPRVAQHPALAVRKNPLSSSVADTCRRFPLRSFANPSPSVANCCSKPAASRPPNSPPLPPPAPPLVPAVETAAPAADRPPAAAAPPPRRPPCDGARRWLVPAWRTTGFSRTHFSRVARGRSHHGLAPAARAAAPTADPSVGLKPSVGMTKTKREPGTSA